MLKDGKIVRIFIQNKNGLILILLLLVSSKTFSCRDDSNTNNQDSKPNTLSTDAGSNYIDNIGSGTSASSDTDFYVREENKDDYDSGTSPIEGKQGTEPISFPIVRTSPQNYQTNINSTTVIELIVSYQNSPMSAKKDSLLYELANQVSLIELASNVTIKVDLSIQNVEPPMSERRVVTIKPIDELDEGWYAIHISVIPEGLEWMGYAPSPSQKEDGSVETRFHVGSLPMIRTISFIDNDGNDTVVTLAFSEYVKSSSSAVGHIRLSRKGEDLGCQIEESWICGLNNSCLQTNCQDEGCSTLRLMCGNIDLSKEVSLTIDDDTFESLSGKELTGFEDKSNTAYTVIPESLPEVLGVYWFLTE